MPPQAASAASGGDPSMEDILASIRRILTEDEAAPAAAAKAPAEPATPPVATTVPAPMAPPMAPAPAAPQDDDGVLDLSAAMLVEEYHEPPLDSAHPPPGPEPAHDATITDEFLEPHIAVPIPQPDHAGVIEDEHLVAPEAAAAAASSVSQLVRRLSIDRAAAVYRGGPTIEDVVREEMRPLLKAWLDENLPRLVERLVRAEIERVVARGLQ